MDSRGREIILMGNTLFSKKRTVDSLWQEIALNFYPERADFTDTRNEGAEYSDHLYSSYPVLARRELGNLMSANLRPQSKKWFTCHISDMDLDDRSEERRFLEHLSDIQWRAMYNPRSGLVRATKQADHDFVTFGNAVILGSPNANMDGLLFRNFHLRDCVWAEDPDGMIDEMHRNWAPTARQLYAKFGDKVSKEVRKLCEKEPYKEVKCRHVVMPRRIFEKKKPNGNPYEWTSFLVETETETVLEEVGMSYFPYVVPRWMTVSGSVFGRSMATAVALPDGRTMQVVVRTIREAGEKYVDPPMIAIADAIRGDIPLFAGGITIADMEYDERLGEVLRPVTQNPGSMPVGFEIAAALKEDIRNAFMLDKITLPDVSNADMTAFEVRRRLEEHIKSASPVFEPVEKDYSSPLCELGFNILMKHGGFPLQNMPQSLRGRDVRFTFRSPISDMTDDAEARRFTEIVQTILMPIAQIDPSQMEQVNLTSATRDAMKKAGWPEKHFNDEKKVEARRKQMMEQAQQAQMMAMAEQGAGAAEKGGRALQAINQSGQGRAA